MEGRLKRKFNIAAIGRFMSIGQRTETTQPVSQICFLKQDNKGLTMWGGFIAGAGLADC
jgi:hypothetical protein